EEERDFARPGSPEENLPLVVLVNEGSASASEIVSGALKNLNRAVILGEQTFGKGSVQTIYDLQDDSGLKLTIAKYLAAGRIPVQTVGVMPDIFLQPVTLSKKRINLIKDEVPREDSLSKKTTPYAVDSKPVFTLRYLGEEDPDEPNIDLEAQKEAKISLEQDLPVRLAKGILIQSRSLSRQQEIKKSLPFLETVRSEEEKKIAAAISRIGIDWTTGMNSQKPAAVISLEILNEKGEKRQELIPGKESTLQLTVENKGRAPFTQLHGVMQSEDAFFKNHEFIFGRIEPKQKKSWVLPLKVPDFMIPRDVPVTIHFEEGNKNNPDPFKTNFKIAVLPSPLYGFTFKGHDNGSFSSKGNGDGKLQKGESISLQISLKNHGPRISEQPLVNLINPDKAPIFIEKGRVELSPLAPGETANTTLVFHLDPAQTPDEFQLELEIADGKIGNRFSKKLKFKMNGELPETKENAEAVPPSIFIDKIPLSSKFPQEILNGYVTDNRKPKSLMIFVDEEKVYYAESQEGVPFKFHKNILLKKGSNLITLMAEDNEGLKSQRQWFLWRQ
ncbi:MAG: S41 family peptidase, partial [bacterium]|nr:S41 family peptidase [bacterium]